MCRVGRASELQSSELILCKEGLVAVRNDGNVLNPLESGRNVAQIDELATEQEHDCNDEWPNALTDRGIWHTGSDQKTAMI